MTIHYILRAAVRSMTHGHHSPHCFRARAHVPGQGYVNDGTILADRPEFLRQLEHVASNEIENALFADGYAERGYDDPKKGIVLANWNNLPRGLDTILEQAGYAVEWSDEWALCDDCFKIFRTSPDSYAWTPSGEYCEQCSACLCHACHKDAHKVDEDEERPADES